MNIPTAECFRIPRGESIAVEEDEAELLLQLSDPGVESVLSASHVIVREAGLVSHWSGQGRIPA